MSDFKKHLQEQLKNPEFKKDWYNTSSDKQN